MEDGALHRAAYENRAEDVRALLDQGADLNGAVPNDDAAGSPLHWAASRGSVTAMAVLLDRGADPNGRDRQGLTPLHVAAGYGHALACSLLLAMGADVDARDGASHRTPLHWACAVSMVRSDTALCLIKAGAQVALADDFGMEPLHHAVMVGKWDDTVALLRAGAPVNHRDKAGAVPLDHLKLPPGFGSDWLRQRLGGPRDLYHARVSEAAKVNVRLALPFLVLPAVAATLAFLPFWTGLVATAAVLIVAGLLMGHFMPIARWETSVGIMSGVYPASFLVVAATHLVDRNLREGIADRHPYLHLVFLVLMGTIPWVMFQLRRSDPGYLARAASAEDTKQTVLRLARSGRLTKYNYCIHCGIERPPRAKHERSTGRCIKRFDHFCDFIANNVGQQNHGFFLAVLVTTIVAQALWVYMAAEHAVWYSLPAPSALAEALGLLWHRQVVDALSVLGARLLQGYLSWTVLLVLWTLVNTFWLGGLLVGQIYLNAGCNLTTYEMMNLKALPYLWRTSLPAGPHGHLRFPLTHFVDWVPKPHDNFGFDATNKVYFNEFDRGFWSNLASLFEPSPVEGAASGAPAGPTDGKRPKQS